MPVSATMHLRLSGTPQILAADGNMLNLAPRDAALLAWLALEGPTARARLCTLLWPASASEQARSALRQRLFKLKRTVGGDVVTGTDVLAIAPGVAHDLDAAYSLIGDLELSGAPELDAWLQARRAERGAAERVHLQARIETLTAAGDHGAALTLAERLVQLDPASETAYRLLMQAHYLAGDRAAALMTYERCARMLEEDIGVQPSGATLALRATIEEAGAHASPPSRTTVPASVLRPPRLVGRAHELQRLMRAWDAGQVAVVCGEAGMGKSRLLQVLGEQRKQLVYSAARPGDADVPYAVLARLLHTAGEARATAAPAPLATSANRELARLLPEFEHLAEQSEALRLVALQRAVAAFLHEALEGADHVGGFVVDDLQFADAASLEMLAALICADPYAPGAPGATVRTPLRWALAHRPADPDTPLHKMLQTLMTAVRLVNVDLQTLDRRALAELIDTLGLPGMDGDTLAPDLLRATGGNPMFALETIKQAWIEGSVGASWQGGPLPRPASVGRLIEARIARLSPTALALARVASIAEVDFDIGMAEAALGVAAIRLADALNELETAQVMRGTQFTHDLVHEAVTRTIPSAIAAHVHAQVASWLARHDGEPARVAGHWIESGRPVEALIWLEQAAALARQALRNREAVQFLERKAEIEQTAGDMAAAYATLAQAVFESFEFDLDEARAYARCDWLERLATSPNTRCEARLLRVNLAMRRYDEALANPLALQTLAEAEALGNTRVAMECRILLVYLLLERERVSEALAHAEACIGWVDAHASEVRRGELHTYLGGLYATTGQLDRAYEHHDQAVAIARRLNGAAHLATVLGNCADTHIRAGNLRAARLCLAEAQDLASAHADLLTGKGPLHVLQARVECTDGHYDEALRLIGDEQVVNTDSALLRRSWLRRAAECWLQLGQWARVRKALDALSAHDKTFTVFERVHSLRLKHAWLHAHGTASGDELDAALRCLPQDGWHDMRELILILRTNTLPPERALEQLRMTREGAARRGFRGHVLEARLREMHLLASADPPAAHAHALTALAEAQDTDLLDSYRATLWLRATQALASAGDHDRARAVLAQGCAWVRATARDHVPAPFRDSFLHRNPINRELLELATRMRA